MPKLQVDTVNINQTEAVATLTYDQIVETLGMRVGVEGNLSSLGAGTTTTVDWGVPDANGQFGATVRVVQDHNYVAPAPQASDASGGTADPSLNSGITAPATPHAPPAPPPSGLTIPGAPPAAAS